MDQDAASVLMQAYQRVPEEITSCFRSDSERLTQAIRDRIRQKSEATPDWPSRDKAIGLRLLRTKLLVVGELCGDLGQDFWVPNSFTGENSLLNRDAEISESNRRKNMDLTTHFKGNLFKMQSSMTDKAHSIYEENIEHYERVVDGVSMADACDHDAQQIEYEILLPFARACNNWNIDELTG